MFDAKRGHYEALFVLVFLFDNIYYVKLRIVMKFALPIFNAISIAACSGADTSQANDPSPSNAPSTNPTQDGKADPTNEAS